MINDIRKEPAASSKQHVASGGEPVAGSQMKNALQRFARKGKVYRFGQLPQNPVFMRLFTLVFTLGLVSGVFMFLPSEADASDTHPVLTQEGYIFTNDDGVSAGEEGGVPVPIDVNVVATLSFSDGSSTTYQTSSLSPTSGLVYYVFIGTGDTSIKSPSSVTGWGLTWEQVIDQDAGGSGDECCANISWYRASGSTAGGQLSINYASAPTMLEVTIVEVSGVPTTGNGADSLRNPGTSQGDSSTATHTLPAFDSTDNGTIGAVVFGNDDTPSLESGWTNLNVWQVDDPAGQDGGNDDGDQGGRVMWRSDNDTTVSSNWFEAERWAIAGAELVAASSGGSSPVTATHLATGGTTTSAQQTQDTDSISPSADQLVLASIATDADDFNNWCGESGGPTLTGNNLSWQPVNAAAEDHILIWLFAAVGSSPTSGAVTIDCGSGTDNTLWGWSFVEFDNADVSSGVSSALVQDNFAEADASSLTVNLSAFADSGNATFGAFMTEGTIGSTPAINPGTGFTEIVENEVVSGEIKLYSEFRDDEDQTVDISMSGTEDVSGVAVEIQRASSGEGSETIPSAQAGSEFSSGKTLDAVRAGERINLRMHLTNSGTAINSDDELALFYDRGDGIWSKVKHQQPAQTDSGDCDTASELECTVIAATNILEGSKAAIDNSGRPWVAFVDATSDNLMVASYVGTGGDCDSLGGSEAWSCEVVDATGDVGSSAAIMVDPSDNAWISYHDATNADLKVANYVGSGGNCDDTGGSDAWQCTVVEATDFVGELTSIAFDAEGDPWISYYHATDDELKVAEHVGSGGNCDTLGGSDAWQCTTVDAVGNSGLGSAIAFDGEDKAWIAHNDGINDDLRVAEHVGSGGNCDDTGGSDAWQCTVVVDTHTSTEAVGLAMSPDGIPWISHYGEGQDAEVAYYVDSGGNCDTNGGSDAWQCTDVDTTGNVGDDNNIAFDPSGTAWVSYYDVTNGSIEAARYVGSGGNCDSVGSGSDEWECMEISDSGSGAERSSVVFDGNGTAWVVFTDTTSFDVEIANLVRSGEISIATSTGVNDGNSLDGSHADMTSAGDDANRDDADCLDGSASWNNGVYFGAENGTDLTLADGNTTPQCTEVMWTLDTSQATPGTTYRFIVATEDAFSSDKGPWRGPVAVATDGYPTLTIRGDEESTYRYSKDVLAQMASCTNSAWGCSEIDDSVAGTGEYTSIAFDLSGNPWASYYNATSGSLMVANYVGAGGNCTDSAWQCVEVDDSAANTGRYPSIGFDSSGKAWVAYQNVTTGSLTVANYVGAGGNCTDSTWQCATIDAGGGGFNPSIAFDQAGNPWISYEKSDALNIANYVGTGGNCTDSAWNCTVVDSSAASTGGFTSLAIDHSGAVWVSYRNNTAGSLMVARYVGTGGNCTDSAWNCTVVDSSVASTGWFTSISVDPSGNPWISYHSSTEGALMVARYVGTGGNCTDSAWQCTVVDDPSSAAGIDTSIAFDSSGNPWISHKSQVNDSLMSARYVGTGGNCDDTGGSDAWQCSEIDNTAVNTGTYTSLAFDYSGNPWISYHNITSGSLMVSKLDLPPDPLGPNVAVPYNGRNAGSGDFRYRLTAGLSPYTDPYGICGSTLGASGYCGLYHPEGRTDSLMVSAGERPAYGFSTRYDDNTLLPTARVYFKTDMSPATENVVLQAYRFGTTNAWETVATYTNAGCASDNCQIRGLPAGPTSEYFEADGGNYWVHFRLYQTEAASAYTLELDSFTAPQTQQHLRHGRTFRENITDPLRW